MEKQWIVGKRKIKLSWFWKRPNDWPSRHGGGWDWHVGFTTCNPFRDIVIYLLWGSIRIMRIRDDGQRTMGNIS